MVNSACRKMVCMHGLRDSRIRLSTVGILNRLSRAGLGYICPLGEYGRIVEDTSPLLVSGIQGSLCRYTQHVNAGKTSCNASNQYVIAAVPDALQRLLIPAHINKK
jgi:hypothetical protein